MQTNPVLFINSIICRSFRYRIVLKHTQKTRQKTQQQINKHPPPHTHTYELVFIDQKTNPAPLSVYII